MIAFLQILGISPVSKQKLNKGCNVSMMTGCFKTSCGILSGPTDFPVFFLCHKLHAQLRNA